MANLATPPTITTASAIATIIVDPKALVTRSTLKVYKKAMAALQDDYYERVGARFGLLRIGPRLQHLTRREWKERKRQAELLAQAHSDVQAFAHNVKAIAKSHIAAQRAEADRAAQAKNDAITMQSHHRLTPP